MQKIFTRAKELPLEWNRLAEGNIYLSAEYLAMIENTQGVPLSYHAFFFDGVLDSCFVYFLNPSLNLKLLQGKTFYKPANFVYIPASISREMFVIGKKTKNEVCAALKALKGITVIMNADADINIDGFTGGTSFPRCVLDVRWSTFGDYLSSLKSGYRRFCKKVLCKSQGLQKSVLTSNSQFDNNLYELYLNVYNKSETKLERLSIEFFKANMFDTIVFTAPNGETAGFVQLLKNNKELIFEFTGINYELNEKYDVYKRMLYEIVEFAIENEFTSIDFGQTADRAKLQLGCRHEPLKLFVRSSNFILNLYFKMFIKNLEHKVDKTNYHIFSEKPKEEKA